MNGKQLGDDLTDNNYEDDGYRFHDVLHLAHVAYLGWSPVLRSLMKRKRKSDQDPTIDEVEDGARARIVEEALLKVVHSEGEEIAAIAYPQIPENERTLFASEVDIPLSFFKLIRRYTKGLEVEKNSFEEWKAAIRNGYEIFNKLKSEGQGTVTVDLEKRSIGFIPEVYVDAPSPIIGVGSCTILLGDFNEHSKNEAIKRLTNDEQARINTSSLEEVAILFSAKKAILESLNIEEPSILDFQSISLTKLGFDKFSVKANATIQQRMWDKDVISFKTSMAKTHNSVYCTALACCGSACLT